MKPPYYTVIFTSLLSENEDGYTQMSEIMENLAKEQPGYVGIESAKAELGITISYWENIDAIKN